MKKLITVTIMFIISSFIILCQEDDNILKNKKGNPILPVAGEFAVGISANPLFDYAGNMLNGSSYNDLSMSLLNNNMLFGKYYLTSSSAVRFKVIISKSNETLNNSVDDDNNPGENVNDELKRKYTHIALSPGYEIRKGESRLQVAYGGELMFGIYSSNDKYSYGNRMTTTNTSPTTTYNFYNGNSFRTSSRILNSEDAKSIGIGLRGFVGIEYFILPKISVGSEIGFGYQQTFNGTRESRTESWDFFDDVKEIETIDTEKSNSYTISSDILNGQVYLLFHF